MNHGKKKQSVVDISGLMNVVLKLIKYLSVIGEASAMAIYLTHHCTKR
jgi:hypothetical protein